MPAGQLVRVQPTAKQQIRSFLKSVTRRKKRKTSYASAKSVKPVRGQGNKFFGSPNPFPLVWKGAKQRYSESKTLTVGAIGGTFGVDEVYTLNDQFDPRFTVGGHQPYARDTFATMYERYKVTGVTVDVSFNAPSIAGIAVAIFFANPTNTYVLNASYYERVREMPQTIVRTINDTGSQKVRIRKYIPMWKILGVTKLQYEADIGIYDALAGGSPSATAGMGKMYIAIADLNGGTTATCLMNTTITMHTDWYQRKVLAQS